MIGFGCWVAELVYFFRLPDYQTLDKIGVYQDYEDSFDSIKKLKLEIKISLIYDSHDFDCDTVVTYHPKETIDYSIFQPMNSSIDFGFGLQFNVSLKFDHQSFNVLDNVVMEATKCLHNWGGGSYRRVDANVSASVINDLQYQIYNKDGKLPSRVSKGSAVISAIMNAGIMHQYRFAAEFPSLKVNLERKVVNDIFSSIDCDDIDWDCNEHSFMSRDPGNYSIDIDYLYL